MKKIRPDHRHTLLAASIAAALVLGAANAQALTLGRAVVQSALGERLRAEIEFENLNAAEAESLRASIASADQFRQAGVQFSPALSGARVVLQRIANRRASLLITSNRPIQEPFIDIVLDINWSGGRLVRSYTMLLDLPGTQRSPRSVNLTPYAGPSGLAAPSTAAPPPMVSAPPPARPQTAPPPPPPRAARAAPEPERRGPPPSGAPPAPPLVDDPYRVRSGDSLSEVAQRGTRPGGISLDRLVLAMYRDNPDAFVDGNIHKLRKGVVLTEARTSTIDAISDSEARQIIKAQSVDFDAYRRQLAESPKASPEASTRSASGRVEAEVQVREKPKSASPDILTLSKPGAASAPADSGILQAAQREREQAAARVAELAKNVQELARLSGEAASQPASTVSTAAAAGAADSGAGPQVAVASDSAASMPAGTASAADTPVDSQPVATVDAPTKPAAPTAMPTEEPGVMDSLLDDNLPAVGLAGGLLALLAGFGIFRLLRRRRGAAPETSFLESRLKPDSFFGASGGEKVDTSEVPATGTGSSMMTYSLSQLDAIGDVDPVAEADVYMAYGRDLQAEEILKEAMRTNPERLAIHTKLLEVYAKRRDAQGFEQLAHELFALTEGQGEDWERARQLGQQLDPGNPLYSEEGQAPDQASKADASAPVGLDLATMPLSVLPGDTPPSSKFDLDLDLDLGMEEPAPAVPTLPPDAKPDAAAPKGGDQRPKIDNMLDFTPSSFEPKKNDQPGATKPDSSVNSAKADKGDAKPTQPDSFSMSEFSLDLELPEPSELSSGPGMLPPIESEMPASEIPSDFDPDSGLDEGDPLARKLELADEFRQIGDVDGARELLQEVIDGADGALKSKAKAMLASLS